MNGEPSAGGQPPAGWYPDPSEPTVQRWWDGEHWTSDTANRAAAGPSPSRARRSPWKIAAIAGTAAAVLAIAVGLGVSAIDDLFDARLAERDTAPATRPERALPPAQPDLTGWSSAVVLGGGGLIGYDPAWPDMYDAIGGDQIEARAATDGDDISVDGAWLISGDAQTGGTLLVVHSARHVADSVDARTDAHRFAESSAGDPTEVTIVAESAVSTGPGYDGWEILYEFPYQGSTVSAVLILISDEDNQVYILASGDEAHTPAVDTVELVANTLSLF